MVGLAAPKSQTNMTRYSGSSGGARSRSFRPSAIASATAPSIRNRALDLSSLRFPAGSRVTPLAWGMTAALVGTLFANVFYLTMSFYYFYVFVMLLLALPIVFGAREPVVAARARPARLAASPARAR